MCVVGGREGDMTTEADGMHPAGMHSSWWMVEPFGYFQKNLFLHLADPQRDFILKLTRWRERPCLIFIYTFEPRVSEMWHLNIPLRTLILIIVCYTLKTTA